MTRPANRPKISDEDTEYYGLRVPASLKKLCLAAGPKGVREILSKHLIYVGIEKRIPNDKAEK